MFSAEIQRPKRKFSNADGELAPQKRSPEPWLGILCKQIRTSGQQNGERMVDQLHDHTREEAIKVSHKRLFGNPTGITVMDQLDSLQQQVQEIRQSTGEEIRNLQGQVKSLKDKSKFPDSVEESYVIVRRYVLEGRDEAVASSENSQDKDQEVTDRRNERAHGGNIAVDTYILMGMEQEENSKLEQCRQKYRQMYGIDYQTIMNDIWDAPAVIKIYDFRAHVRLMKRWVYAKGENESLATDIQVKSDWAISNWESWIKGSKASPPPEIDEAAREIRELYLQHQA